MKSLSLQPELKLRGKSKPVGVSRLESIVLFLEGSLRGYIGWLKDNLSTKQDFTQGIV